MSKEFVKTSGETDKIAGASAAETKPDANEGGVAAVDRALSIINAFEAGDRSLSLNALSARTGYYKSTILRLLDSLEKFDYIRRLDSGYYQLGATVARLAFIYRQSFGLDEFVLPQLRELVAQTNESASFYVRSGEQRLCLFRIDSPQIIRDHVRSGDVLPLTLGAGGHILSRFASGVAAAKDALPTQFVSVTLGERHPDTAAVAAPVFDADGKLAGAVNISGPRNRFNETAVQGFGTAILHAARTLTLQLGGDISTFPATYAGK